MPEGTVAVIPFLQQLFVQGQIVDFLGHFLPPNNNWANGEKRREAMGSNENRHRRRESAL